MVVCRYLVLAALLISSSLSDELERETEKLRVARDVTFSGLPKGGRVVIPNWNPNVKTDPWQVITGRKPRSVEFGVTDRLPRSAEFGETERLRVARDVTFSGLSKGPRVVIPNWNPNVKTKPWQVITGKKPRSVDFEETDLFPRSAESRETEELRVTRDVRFSGLPKGGRVVIPNWNPNVKTEPWQVITGRKSRSLE